MGSTSDIRKGLCIKYNNDIYKIIDFLHVKPGKGPAFVRTKLKNVSTGRVIDNTFSAGHKIETIRVETSKYQFLYNDAENFHFMNNDDFNQITIDKKMLENSDFLKEGEIVNISINSENQIPLSVDMPSNVTLKVIQTEPGVHFQQQMLLNLPLLKQVLKSMFHFLLMKVIKLKSTVQREHI